MVSDEGKGNPMVPKFLDGLMDYQIPRGDRLAKHILLEEGWLAKFSIVFSTGDRLTSFTPNSLAMAVLA